MDKDIFKELLCNVDNEKKYECLLQLTKGEDQGGDPSYQVAKSVHHEILGLGCIFDDEAHYFFDKCYLRFDLLRDLDHFLSLLKKNEKDFHSIMASLDTQINDQHSNSHHGKEDLYGLILKLNKLDFSDLNDMIRTNEKIIQLCQLSLNFDNYEDIDKDDIFIVYSTIKKDWKYSLKAITYLESLVRLKEKMMNLKNYDLLLKEVSDFTKK